MLKLGEKIIKSLYLGDKAIAKVFLGDKLVFNKKPYYCEVEYLESTGTQYIDTGLTGNSDTKAELALIISTQATGNVGIFGSRGNSANSNLLAVGYGTSALAVDFNNSSYSHYRAGISYELDKKYICYTSKEIRFIKDENGLVLAENTTLCNDTMSTSNLLLFAETGVASKQQGKMFYAKIWDDNILVRDFTPVLDNNMKPCMYDKVSGKLFYNKGTGEFIAGDLIQKPTHTEIEYLEGDSVSYINTGVMGDSGLTVEMKVYVPYVTGTTYFLGASDGTRRFFPIYFEGSRICNRMGTSTSATRGTEGVLTTGWHHYLIQTSTTKDFVSIRGKENSNYHTVREYVDGELVYRTGQSLYQGATDKDLYLFGINNNGTPVIGNTYFTDETGYLRMAFCKIWNYAGELIRDYIPVEKSDGVKCLYDKVEGKYYEFQTA